MTIPVDYEILRLAWWALLGLVLIGFAIMDGFDLGVAILLPMVARDDLERRTVLGAIGPVWDGNQVWLILGGGAAFAAWPPLYATAFSLFYIPLLLVLAALILRPVGFDFRNKIEDRRWRQGWDWALFIGGVVPSLVFGMAMGNLFLGMPFELTRELRTVYGDTYFAGMTGLFPLLCGLTSVAMMIMHGGTFLVLKTEGPIAARSRRAVLVGATLLIVLFAAAGMMIATTIGGHVLVTPPNLGGPSDPLLKQVTVQTGAWLANYHTYPWMTAAPVLAFAGAITTAVLVGLNRPGSAFLASAVSVFGVVATAGLALFPFLLPSSTRPDHGLTVWDSSSSQLTLFIMLIAAVVVLPMVAGYTTFVYRVLRGKVDPHSSYH